MSELAGPLVLDADTGVNDAPALLYACADNEAQILGVSMVVSNVPLVAGTKSESGHRPRQFC
jgi:inosine-uridine nucleoside N-ribohydrolase